MSAVVTDIMDKLYPGRKRFSNTPFRIIDNYINVENKSHNTFYRHKQGKVHLTVFEIEHYHVRDKKKRLTGEIEINYHVAVLA